MSLPDPQAWPVETDATTLLGADGGDLLARRATATPDRTALVDVDTGERTSYAAFDRAVDRLAAGLDDHALRGGRVALLLETGPAFARTYFAVGRLGASVVPFDVARPAGDLSGRAARAGVDLLVCDRPNEATAVDAAPAGVPVASVDAPDRDAVRSLPDPEATVSTDVTPADADADTERLVLFTSGTTGTPKGVRLTLGNLVASAVGSARRLGVDPDDRWLVPLPMYHMGGLAPLVRSTLYGTTTVLQRRFDAASTASVLDDRAVTGVSLVPTMLGRLFDADWTPADAVRFVLLGGAPASPALLERALDLAVPVYPTYGATETASQVATATPDEVATHPGTVGRPLAGTTVSVRSADGDVVDPGETGELVVDGPTVTPGYLDTDRTVEAFGPDGFHTGDLGTRDEAGRLWIRGRIDDRIVTGGENVSAVRVADALSAHEDVAEAAVVGLPDEEWGERVAALVVVETPASDRDGDGGETGGRPDRRAILTRAREELPGYAVPKTLGFTDSLPRTASGTVDRDAVRDRLRESER